MKFVSPLQRGTICQCKCPGSPAPTAPQVQPDVKAFGVQRLGQQGDEPGNRGHRLGVLVGREFVEPPFVKPRGHEQMAVAIRVPVQHRDDRSTTMHEQVLPIVGIGHGPANEALRVGRATGKVRLSRLLFIDLARDVGQPPGGPKLLVFQRHDLPRAVRCFDARRSAGCWRRYQRSNASTA